MARLTVDGDGNGLGEDESIGANKGWDLAEWVDLEKLGIDTVDDIGVDELEVDVVGNSNCLDGSGAWVSVNGVKLSERHFVVCDGGLKEGSEMKVRGILCSHRESFHLWGSLELGVDLAGLGEAVHVTGNISRLQLHIDGLGDNDDVQHSRQHTI